MIPELLGIIDHAGALGLISLYFELMSPAIPPSSAALADLNWEPNETFARMVNFGADT